MQKIATFIFIATLILFGIFAVANSNVSKAEKQIDSCEEAIKMMSVNWDRIQVDIDDLKDIQKDMANSANSIRQDLGFKVERN